MTPSPVPSDTTVPGTAGSPGRSRVRRPTGRRAAVVVGVAVIALAVTAAVVVSRTRAAAPTPWPTQVGAALWPSDGQHWTDALAAADSRYGRLPVVRVYDADLPPPWPGDAGDARRPVVVSFKAAPQDVVSGSLDATLRTWFADAPRDRAIYWSYYHEPEDNIEGGEFTAADYRAAWTRLRSLADEAKNPQLKATLILMTWSLSPGSGRDWRDYYPGADAVDVLAWDGYNSGANEQKAADDRTYTDPAELYQPAVDVSRAEGKPFGFAEWGSLLVPGDDGTGRADWIRTTVDYFRQQGALFATYFDTPVGGEYRLLDTPSQDAFRDAVRG